MNTAQQDVASSVARIMIVDDHPTVCEGLAHRLSSRPHFTVCGEASGAEEALEKIPSLYPDIVIVDLALKESNGLEFIKTLKARHPGVRALVHSMYEETIYADRCLQAGAMGYVNKEADPNEVIDAVNEILADRIYLSSRMSNILLHRKYQAQSDTDPVSTLTKRQMEVFRRIGEGKSAAQIAGELHISVHTVETHRENIKRKLNVDSVSELTRRAALWVSEIR